MYDLRSFDWERVRERPRERLRERDMERDGEWESPAMLPERGDRVMMSLKWWVFVVSVEFAVVGGISFSTRMLSLSFDQSRDCISTRLR